MWVIQISSRGLFTPMFQSTGGKAVQPYNSLSLPLPVSGSTILVPTIEISKINRHVCSHKHRTRNSFRVESLILMKIKSNDYLFHCSFLWNCSHRLWTLKACKLQELKGYFRILFQHLLQMPELSLHARKSKTSHVQRTTCVYSLTDRLQSSKCLYLTFVLHYWRL